MAAKSAVQIADVLGAHDFAGYERIVDVGAGEGHLLRAIIGMHADVTGVLFDLPPVIEAAHEVPARSSGSSSSPVTSSRARSRAAT